MADIVCNCPPLASAAQTTALLISETMQHFASHIAD